MFNMFNTINNGKLPTKDSKYSSSVDVYANEDSTIGAGETDTIGLGIAINLEKLYTNIAKEYSYKFSEEPEFEVFLSSNFNNFLNSHYIYLKPISNLRKKYFISHTPIFYLNYPDELKMIINNPLHISETEINDDLVIKKGDKIAQILLMEHKSYLFGVGSEEEEKNKLNNNFKV